MRMLISLVLTSLPAAHFLDDPLSQIRSKHLRIPCLTAIPYLFAMASMASVKELFSTSILRNSFVAFLQ